jgi:hypothetical protein
LIFISYSGKVFIVASCSWIEPKTGSKEEEEAAERARQMHVSSWRVCVNHKKGTCNEDFENRIFRDIFILNKMEIKGGWRVVAE